MLMLQHYSAVFGCLFEKELFDQTICLTSTLEGYYKKKVPKISIAICLMFKFESGMKLRHIGKQMVPYSISFFLKTESCLNTLYNGVPQLHLDSISGG